MPTALVIDDAAAARDTLRARTAYSPNTWAS